MGVNPLEIIQPSLRYWEEDKQRRRLEAHIAVVDAPPWGIDFEAGRIVLEMEPPATETPTDEVKT